MTKAQCDGIKKWPIVCYQLPFSIKSAHHDIFFIQQFLRVGLKDTFDGTQLEIAQKREKTFAHHTKIHLKDSWYFRIARKLFFEFLSCKHAVTNVIFLRKMFNVHFPLWNRFFFWIMLLVLFAFIFHLMNNFYCSIKSSQKALKSC